MYLLDGQKSRPWRAIGPILAPLFELGSVRARGVVVSAFAFIVARHSAISALMATIAVNLGQNGHFFLRLIVYFLVLGLLFSARMSWRHQNKKVNKQVSKQKSRQNLGLGIWKGRHPKWQESKQTKVAIIQHIDIYILLESSQNYISFVQISHKPSRVCYELLAI